MNTIQFYYRNHRSEVRLREIIPYGIQWQNTKWHIEDQWILHGHDVEKNALRSFALKDCNFLIGSEPDLGERK